MKKIFTLFAMVCLTAISAMAAKVTEVTDIEAAIANNTVVNLAIGDQYLYGSSAQNTAMADANTAKASTNGCIGYKIEKDGDNLMFRCVTPAGGDYMIWGRTEPNYLNAQPQVGGVTFNLNNGSQKGTDMPNGAVWTLVDGALKNVGNGGYFNGTKTSADPVQVKIVTIEADPEPTPEPLVIPEALQTLITNKTIFSLKSGDSYLYGSTQQNVAVGTWEQACDAANNATNYVLEADEYYYYLRAVKGDGSDISAWGDTPCWLNTTSGGVIFEMGKNKDMKNGSSWLIEEVSTGKYSIKNVAKNGYMAINGAQANLTADVVNTWQFYVPKPNTIPADIYSVTATVTMAEGIAESSVPADFKKYIGTYKTVATIEGDEKSLVITENKENGLFTSFEIKDDEVAVNPTKVITLGGKEFTVRATDEAEAGALAIAADGEGWKMDDAVIYYNGNKIATVSNITMAKAKEEVIVKVTNVNYDDPTKCYYDAETTEWLTGYDKISGGKVEFSNTAWGVNWITYVGVDAFTMKGVVKKATLKAEVSGSTDSKRYTTWGVGYNTTVWSADMTYETADRNITLLGGTQNSSSKASGSYNELTFDVTDAFATGKMANLVIYETAAAGGYIKNITVEVEMVGTPLEAAKDKALKKVEGLAVGTGLFMYSQDAIDAYKTAVEAAETVEAVEAIAMPEQTMPDATKKYKFANVTAEGTYLGQANLSAEPVAVKFEATEGGYYLNINGMYLNMAGGNTWSMNATETPSTVWTINVADGKYSIKGPNGIVGTDSKDAGSATYGNKTIANNGLWTIEDYIPTAAKVVAADDAVAVIKFVENGKIVMVKNGKKYTAAGAEIK